MKKLYYVLFITNLVLCGSILHGMDSTSLYELRRTGQETHYTILGVSSDSTTEEINKAYKRLATQYHPDKNYGNEKAVEPKFKLIVAAYDTLKDAEKKCEYDNSLNFDSSVHKSFIWDWFLLCKISALFCFHVPYL